MKERISRRGFLQSGAALAAAGVAGASSERAAGANGKRPNILFIVSDQHNPRCLGAAGHPDVRTPRLDALADEGTRFANAFSNSAVCCPARYSMWTGRYARSHGLRYNGVREPLTQTTAGEAFKAAGYATASIGKAHMKHDVRRHGFDHPVDRCHYRRMLKERGLPHPLLEGDFLPYAEVQDFAGYVGASYADNDLYYAGYWANEAIDFMREPREQPFCLWLQFYGPHPPYIASKEFVDLYDPAKLELPPSFYSEATYGLESMRYLKGLFGDLDERQMREILACYYAYTTQIDHNIGRVLDELERLGMADNTIVVYTADHGDMACEHRCFRKGLLNLDALMGVPLIIRAPGGLGGGAARTELVGQVDYLPTLCELAGVDCPDAAQGESLVPLLRGERAAWRQALFSEVGYPDPGPKVGECRAVRTHSHKYLYHDNRSTPVEQLFDLERDPWEMTNLAGQPAVSGEEAALKERMAQFLEEIEEVPYGPAEPFGPNDACHPDYRGYFGALTAG